MTVLKWSCSLLLTTTLGWGCVLDGGRAHGAPDAALHPDDAGSQIDGSRLGRDASDVADTGQADDSGSPSTGKAPALRNPVALADLDLARQALTLLGSSAVGAEGSCRTCHSLGRPTLTKWSGLTKTFRESCLEDTTLPDRAIVDETFECAAGDSQSGASPLGIYSAAAHLPWFSYLFEHASAAQPDWMRKHEQLVTRAGMPRSGQAWTQAQFDVVAEWFERGLPKLFELVPEDAGEQQCTPRLGPELAAHVANMKTMGWRAKNKEGSLLMFGCQPGQEGATCLVDVPLAKDQPYGAQWDVVAGTRIRVLRDNSQTLSTFWSRASADGRYIASGLIEPRDPAFPSQIFDLQRGTATAVNASIDPTFFPDNSGFLIEQEAAFDGPGGPPGGGFAGDPGFGNGLPSKEDVALICDQSVLAGNPARVTGMEPQCVLLRGQIGLYQQLAKSIDGSDYWVVFGAYESDDGGFERTLSNPSAAFESASQVTFVPMLNQGSKFVPGAATKVQTPRQGDPMLAPSGRLLATRVKGKERAIRDPKDDFEQVVAGQSGYALYLVSSARQGDAVSASVEEVARICVEGGKPVFSFDERWMVIHHYLTDADATELGFSGANDPRFAPYKEQGGANLYLVDLLTGTSRRITNVLPGQYAIYPHFRSDGWIYFVVRTLERKEYFAASDAALVLEARR